MSAGPQPPPVPDQPADGPRPKLVIGTPAYGGLVTTTYVASLLKLQRACAQRRLDFSVLMPSGDALITRARNTLVTQFLDDPAATHLMFIDADIGFEPQSVFRLMEFDAEVCGGVYPTKKIDWARVKTLADAGIDKLESAALAYVIEFVDTQKIGVREGFTPVRYAGTGFLMIRRSALTRLIARHPELKFERQHESPDPGAGSPHRYALFDCMIDPATKTYLSEDFSFCKRWTDAGGEIWIDLTSKLTHVGPMAFHGDVATQFAAPKS